MERIKLTENEKLVKDVLGSNDVVNFNMSEGRIDDIIAKEKAAKFNEDVDKYIERFEKHTKDRQEEIENIAEDISNVEILPMYSRIIIIPFKNNPFQKLRQTESGIIIDTGGLNAQHFNTDTGETEDDKPDIIVGAVQEVGPEVKYIKPGDVVYYREPTAIPVPFFKQGFWSISENQVIAVVNSSLKSRFESIKNGR